MNIVNFINDDRYRIIMWTAKFKIFDEKNKLSLILRKNKIKLYYYPINHYVKKNRYFFIATGLLEGEQRDKEQFIQDLKKLKKAKKDRRLELLEIKGDFFVVITSHTINREIKLFVSTAYNPALVHFEPVIWHEDGWEEWNIASMERKDIENLIRVGETKYKLELLQFIKKKIKNFGFLTLLPELTEKQKQALKLAVDEGYYEYPRKTEVQKLAKMIKLSFSTFQAHLRKAENKIIPFVIKRV